MARRPLHQERGFADNNSQRHNCLEIVYGDAPRRSPNISQCLLLPPKSHVQTQHAACTHGKLSMVVKEAVLPPASSAILRSKETLRPPDTNARTSAGLKTPARTSRLRAWHYYVSYVPPRCRYNPDKPFLFSMSLNLLFGECTDSNLCDCN